MTDEEIIFDFFTLEAAREQAVEQQVAEEPVPSEVSVVPQTSMGGNRTNTMSVSADREEFIRWYEAEVGPWQTM